VDEARTAVYRPALPSNVPRRSCNLRQRAHYSRKIVFQDGDSSSSAVGGKLTLLSELQSKAKTTAKAILPKTTVDFISGCRYRGYVAHISYLLKLKKFRTQFAEANARVPDSIIILPAGCRIAVPPDADVRNAFEHFGWRDPEMVDEFIGFMKLASNAKILWDVGALFGLFSLAFTLRGASRRALAFEPNPSSRTKLEECLQLNPTAKVQVFDCAVGLSDKVVEFERGFHYTAITESPARPGEEDSGQRETVAIKTVSIDELIERDLAPPDIIKIDVEGHEFDVLLGARELLFAKKPLLSIELHPGLLERRSTSGLAIAEYLEDVGYVFHDTDLKRVTKDIFKRQNNFRVVAK
jgi:FkbM family methyltransferase